MALQKQPIAINFSGNVDTKTDPFQVDAGNFISRVNTVYSEGKALKKRNGYGLVTTVSNASTVGTFNNDLCVLGTSSLNTFAAGVQTNAGFIQPMSLGVTPMVRSATSQTTVDVAVGQGLACSVWLDANANSYYQISDSVTGLTIVPQTALPATATMPRVYVLGRYFVVTFLATVSASAHLQYISIPLSAPSSPNAAVDIATNPASITTAYDGFVANNNLYLAWNGSDGGGAIHIGYLTSTLVVSSTVSIALAADLLSVTADLSQPSPVIWITYYLGSSNTIKTHAYSSILASTLATTTVVSSITVNELTSTALNNTLTVFYEVANTYGFAPNAKTDYIASNTCTSAGTVGIAAIVLRGTGLASKSFNFGSSIYVLACYGQAYQPTYFLIDQSGNVICKLAYSNGGGYLINQILPNVNISGSTVQIGYLFKDSLAAVNKTQGVANVNGVYSQLGINLASFTFNTTMQTAEIGGSLHLTGGILWQFDGVKPVEHSFHVWPEDLGVIGSITSGSMIPQQYFYQATYEWTDNAGMIHRSAPSVPLTFTIDTAPANFTGNRTSGSPIISSVSSTANLQVGQAVSGTGIPASTFILSIDSSTQITLTHNASSGSATSTTITPVSLGSLTVNVPTLRQTYKTANKVRIVLYRWSAAQQNYYRTTSITAPNLNDTTVDYISITDSNSDAQILGNDLIYTTGGVVENIAAPACSGIALYNSRVMLIDAEDRNLLWFSKQVIEATPAEFSDLFTIFTPPTTGAQGSTGPTTAISAMDDKLIMFKKNAAYYLTGIGPDNTGSNNDFSNAVFITSTVGTTNPQSIVFMPNGLMFQSSQGIWLLGRNLETAYIGAPVEGFNAQIVTGSLAVPGQNEVRFTLNNNICLSYDYFYERWGWFVNVNALSSTIYQGLHTYLNPYGQVVQETPGLYLDVSEPVLQGFTTSWLNLAGLQGYQRAYRLDILGSFFSPHKLSIGIAYDYGPITQQNVINPSNFAYFYGSDPTYGLSSVGATLEQWKIHLQRQTCMSFQITFQEVYDPFFGTQAGAGLTLSGVNCVVGLKKGYRPIPAVKSVG